MQKPCASWAPFLLRLITGYGFMVHGWAKLSRGTAGFEQLLARADVPLPHIGAVLVPYVELLGGLGILVGAYVAWMAIPLAATMLVAMVSVQLRYGFSSVNTVGLTPEGPVFGPPGYEINLLYIASLLSLALTGAGRLSVEGWLRRKKAGVPGRARVKA